MPQIRKGLIDDFQKQVRTEFTHLFEHELMPFCERAISKSMEGVLEKLGACIDETKEQTKGFVETAEERVSHLVQKVEK